MKKSLLILFIVFLCLSLSLMGCTSGNTGEKIEEDIEKGVQDGIEDLEKNLNDNILDKPSLAGIRLGDTKETVKEKLGGDYQEKVYEEAGHFPEQFYTWQYSNGTIVYIGKDSDKVLEIRSTAKGVGTNLEVKVGDSAEKIFETYRDKYTEPESIHGGKLIGVFKVEDGAALIFDFNTEDGIVNPEDVKPEDRVERIILTYPAHIDESF
ncbi:MAG: hypothetical protein GX207_00240 [Peptococcaceae bacterium]|nr:hypothetical protein [Peptococcaceae bacterium]